MSSSVNNPQLVFREHCCVLQNHCEHQTMAKRSFQLEHRPGLSLSSSAVHKIWQVTDLLSSMLRLDNAMAYVTSTLQHDIPQQHLLL